uniref:Uncharacterized protein n=1 Tax=Anguilla anguilla TaxID=7936 RepID=A0A0E9TY42_ANGAN
MFVICEHAFMDVCVSVRVCIYGGRVRCNDEGLFSVFSQLSYSHKLKVLKYHQI